MEIIGNNQAEIVSKLFNMFVLTDGKTQTKSILGFINHFPPSKLITSLGCKGLLGVEVNENTLVGRKDNKIMGFRKSEHRDCRGIKIFA